MKLVAITDSYEVDELPLPAEYHFRLDSGEDWTLCFVPTVPYDGDADDEEIFGDLFECRAGEIVAGTRPILRGGRREREILDRLGEWLDRTIPPDRQELLLHGKFTKMSQEMVWHRELIWFRRALERRRARLEVD
jgi:hypothetical protein